jgi:hypothetical protein
MTYEYQELIDRFEIKDVSDHLRKEGIPENWLVFNAFRPISGTLGENGEATVWTAYGCGPEGIHFAAVDPENSDGYSGMWYEENLKAKAVRIVYGKGNGEFNEAQLAYLGK